ncbi:acetyltransferase [Flavobacterium aquidurense]|uniref:acyltransferase n=1 Tax=Flavobacterium aquidurense TaxID=362413 RepID=UPI0009168442|nr:acyltransferase [Flavobacterium aquidurense]OXA71995.1 acetyltransferase [Flavobacterium aquidurense]SHH63560.1 Acetyltransferase (isoleucine patch superfamily) [Flavobacterium frigidimaris]
MGLKEKIKSNDQLKNLVHWSVLIPNQTRPRLWIKYFINPFYHKKGKGAIIRRRTRMDVVPWNRFELGINSTIEDFSAINNGVGSVIIGNQTKIGLSNTIIGPVTIGNDIRLAQNITLSGLNHNYEDISIPIHEQGVSTAPISIEDNTWIGANVVVLAGVTIGRHSIIAAGSIVTKDIPPYSVAVGNPARIIKQYNFETSNWEKIKN